MVTAILFAILARYMILYFKVIHFHLRNCHEVMWKSLEQLFIYFNYILYRCLDIPLKLLFLLFNINQCSNHHLLLFSSP